MTEPCRGLPGPRPGRRRALPGLPRLRPGRQSRTIQARIPAGVTRRPAHPAQGQGRLRRARRPGRRPLRGGPREPAPGLRPRGRQPDRRPCRSPSPRRSLGAEIKVPTLGGMPVTLKLPAGTHERPGAAGPRPGRGAQGRHQGRPAGHRSRSRCPAELDDDAREALEKYREATGRPRPAGGAAGRGEGRAEGPMASTSPFAAAGDRGHPGLRHLRRRRSWPGCTRRPCGSTTGWAWSARSRTGGGGRRYSARDIERCARCSGCPRTRA